MNRYVMPDLVSVKVSDSFSQVLHQRGVRHSLQQYKVFNMGHRMELYVRPEDADSIIEISKSFNIDAQIVGRVEAAQSNKLTLVTPFGTFEY